MDEFFDEWLGERSMMGFERKNMNLRKVGDRRIESLSLCEKHYRAIFRSISIYRTFLQSVYHLCIKKRNDSLYSSLVVGILNVERRMTRPK